MTVDRYRPVGDYAFIGDCHSMALVSREGSIDWCCMPRVDSASVFGRLLDADRGGFCSITVDEDIPVSRRYLDDSLVLETTFRGPSGEARLLDCFTMRQGGARQPYRQLLRVVEGVRGWLSFRLHAAIRFDYGEVQPRVKRRGVGGERRLTELVLEGLEGYRGIGPVRIGNAAATQVQLDVYGELLDLAWRWHQRGRSPDDDYWRFLLALVDAAADRWREPDRGLWELRGQPRHFVHSKVLCWVALDRGLKLAEECLRKAPTRRWHKTREEIRTAVETDGYDPDRGVFVQAFGSKALDAALLLLPSVDFVPYDDPWMLRTADTIRTELDDGHGLILRYRNDDHLAGQEGAFVTCSFWLAECLAHQGRIQEARELFDRVASCGSDLALYPEEYDSQRRELCGN
jgi:GH15 family glucan-1,4-alpha-glucosidase